MDRNLIENVQKLRKEGKSFGSIAKEFLITKSQACYCNKINLGEYDEKMSSYQKYVDKVCELGTKCTNINQILHILGKKGTNEYYKQITKILEDNNVDTSHFVFNERIGRANSSKLETKDYLVCGSTIASSELKNKLLKEGLKEHKCERCENTEWEGEPIPLQLHHINGDRSDNRLENLRLLCPNCHALTDNYCGRKLKKEPKKCIICGKEISRKAEYCADCYNDYVKAKTKNGFVKDTFKSRNKRELKYPTKEELINDFKELGSFRAVGKKYGLSDKSIVKWCEKYELPSHCIDMRKYIREIFGEDLKWKFTSGNSKALREYQKKNFKQIELLNSDGSVEKTYSSIEEITNDGFDPKNVHRVCRGKLKTHHKKMFRYK